MHANIVCFLSTLSQNLNEPEKHSVLPKHSRTDKFNAFWPRAAPFRDKWALAAAYQKHPAETGKAAIKNHSLHPRLLKSNLNSPDPEASSSSGTGRVIPHITHSPWGQVCPPRLDQLPHPALLPGLRAHPTHPLTSQ